MGGGYSESRGGWDGGGGGAPPVQTSDLISQREGKQAEVDSVLSVLRDFNNEYGTQIDTEIGQFPQGSSVMGYYDPLSGNIGISQSYFDEDRINLAMDQSANARYHPPRGNKTGMEAVTAHEVGHALTAKAQEQMGIGSFDKAANRIVQDAKRNNKVKGSASDMARRISAYAGKNPAEAIAEAVGDVHCNGDNARKESKWIVSELNKHL